MNTSREQTQIPADTGKGVPKTSTRTRLTPLLVLCPLIVVFLVVESFIPLRTAVQIGADEGFEVAKATLCLKGHHLYIEVWNDQPPLHTFLITGILKYVSPSIFGPRLLTIAFAALLLATVFWIAFRVNGLLVAGITTGLLFASPGFLELASSCMLEIPALATALASLCLLLVVPDVKWFLREAIAGAVFGLAVQMKLVPIIYLPLVPLVVILRQNENSSFFVAIKRSLVFGSCLVASFIAADLLIDRGAYLVHFGQTWHSHFAAAKSVEYGSAADHPFQWALLLKNWDITAPALLGLVALPRRLSARSIRILPLAWLALTFLVFGLHKPWWPYYYIHTAIPLCWFAGIGVAFLVNKMRASPIRLPIAVALVVLGLCSIPWMGARLYLQVVNLRKSPQTYSSPVIAQIKRVLATIS